MCLDGRKPSAGPLLRAAAEYRKRVEAAEADLPERLRVNADDQYVAATTLEQLLGLVADQAATIARLKARLAELERGRGREDR